MKTSLWLPAAAGATVLLGFSHEARAACTTTTSNESVCSGAVWVNPTSGDTGVYGEDDSGNGVVGWTSTGTGVYGNATSSSGTGVEGESSTGIAGFFYSASGTAIKGDGAVEFVNGDVTVESGDFYVEGGYSEDIGSGGSYYYNGGCVAGACSSSDRRLKWARRGGIGGGDLGKTTAGEAEGGRSSGQ